MKRVAVIAAMFCLQAAPSGGQTLDQLVPHRVELTAVAYRGKQAIKVVEGAGAPNGVAYALLKGTDFHNGTIEVELAGAPSATAFAAARGFIGLAFRVRADRFEYIFLRPTNGRADDQVRRNHSTQYNAFPDFDYARLRKESPERYESYVDLEAGAWTRVRIVVDGATARLFVHGADQPALIVNDLKHGDGSGGVALWIGAGTEGYFTGLAVRPAR
jgi:hypothetical protein